MFCKLALLSLVAPLVSALTLQVPENPTTGGSITIKWTSAAGDPPTFSIELLNTVFNNAYAIANNVDPSMGSITLTIPAVPVGAGYTLEAVDIGNINSVYSTTGSFSIGASTASSNPSSTAGSSSRSSSGSGSSSASSSGSGTSRVTTSGGPSTTLVSATTTPVPTTTSPASASTATGSAFNGASGLRVPTGGVAVILLSAIAGAAAVAL